MGDSISTSKKNIPTKMDGKKKEMVSLLFALHG